MSDHLNIAPMGGDPYGEVDELREFVTWHLPSDISQDPALGRPYMLGVDRLARRLLRYSWAIATAISESDFEWALEQRAALTNRLERLTVEVWTGSRHKTVEALQMVEARAQQIIDPSRFA